MEEILARIVEKRINTIKKKSITFGFGIPAERKVPVVLPSFKKGIVISEIKRGSPSEGKLSDITEPAVFAKNYIRSGADVISVLTEEDFFYGNIADLMKVKKAFPKISVLRKDFILYEGEIEISYKIGADIVLLIADVLIHIDKKKGIGLLKKLKEKTESFGMLPLIEVHNEKELDMVLSLDPKLIGINSRDLNTFKINRGYPLALKSKINDSVKVIYESGIRNGIDSFFVGQAGFSGVLVGTSIIKDSGNKNKIKDIKKGLLTGLRNKSVFYNDIFKKIYIEKKTVVKICGITNLADAERALESGADIIGFVFADSPREISLDTAKQISKSLGDRVLKVGVVTDKNLDKAVSAVRSGWLDALQFHGEIIPEKIKRYNVCWYKALQVKNTDDFHKEFYSLITLFDAYSAKAAGGTGKVIDERLLKYAKDNGIKLFLAGGLSPENISHIIKVYSPLMIDVSSGLEKEPGKKDPEKIKKFFGELRKSKAI